jgi:ABC-type nitrate/sulfonate/bicarbonate transport system substrate-binding protein
MRAAQTIPAMLAGGIDFGSATGTGIAAAVSGVDVRLIFALTDRPSFDLIAVPSITSVQKLRGKKLGTSGVGSLAKILARQILIANKIPLEQVTFLPFGTSDVTYVALKAGTIDATMLQIPQKCFAVDEGFRNLASDADVYRAVMGGLTTTKATITERPELVSKTIRATMRSRFDEQDNFVRPAKDRSEDDVKEKFQYAPRPACRVRDWLGALSP